LILAFDTYYFDNKARTVCIAFNNWTDTDNYEVYSEILENVEEYTPGEFYKRELPCILSLLDKNHFNNVEAIIIDGFVYLDDNKKPGLGAHLFEKLDGKIPVIGVAKTNFATIEKLRVALLRGQSKNPLYITAAGMDMEEAADKIKLMSGEFRIPFLLKELDRLTKEKP
jgi:deoxyribonuclease V